MTKTNEMSIIEFDKYLYDKKIFSDFDWLGNRLKDMRKDLDKSSKSSTKRKLYEHLSSIRLIRLNWG